MGISNSVSHLRSAFPDGIPLDSAFVSPALAAALEAAVEDAVAGGGGGGAGGGGAGGGGGWVDVGPLLPSVLSAADVAALLQRVGVLREQERKPARERKAHVVRGGWVGGVVGGAGTGLGPLGLSGWDCKGRRGAFSFGPNVAS